MCPQEGPVPSRTRLPWPLSQTPPQVRPFHQEDFLCSLERAGPQLTCILKGDWLGLYRWVDASAGPGLLLLVGTGCPCPTRDGSAPRPLPLSHRRFFKSPHFDGWYRQRRKEMARQLEALHLEAICEAVRGGWRGLGPWGWGGWG